MLSFQNHKSDLVQGQALNGVLYLAPHTIASSKSVCPGSSAGCRTVCLYHAGRGCFNKVQQARIRKTLRWFDDRPGFMADLEKDIERAEKRALKANLPLYLRLNGTSDLPAMYKHLRQFDLPRFYDYTKLPLRAYQKAIEKHNVSIGFSLDERDRWDMAKEYLDAGHRVAVVFNVRKGEPLPREFRGYRVFDGDISPINCLGRGAIIEGLRPKGRARKDTSGFVRAVGG